MPQAVMNEDWQSFTLTLYDSAYYLGYSKPILPGESIYTCRNEIFKQNWKNTFTAQQFKDIYSRIESLLSTLERSYLASIKKDLEAKYPNRSTSPAFFSKFLLNDDTITTEKIFAYVANSLFGRS